MAGRRIGEVFVAIEADTSMFRAQAFAGLKKSLAGLEGKIPVTADTAQARAQIASLKARMSDLSRQLSEVKIGANGKPAESAIRKIQLELAELAKAAATVTMEADTTKLDAAIAREELRLAKLNEEASTLRMDADTKAAVAKIARLQLQISTFERKLGKLEIGIDDKEINAILEILNAIDAEILALKSDARKIVIDADASRLLYAIAESEAAIAALREEAGHLRIGGEADLAALSAIELKLLGLEEATKRLNPDLKLMNDKLIQGAGAFGRFGIGALTARVALFGGLSAVSGWHIALDVLIESLAVIIPALTVAAAGLAAFGIAGSDAARAVYQRLQNIHTVADATNQVIGPMTGKLEALHAVVRPQVWQLYGDAIAIAHNKTDLFGKLAVSTGAVIDKFAARLTILATSAGPGLTKFIASGTRDLQQFGRIFLNLGDAFGKLIQVTEQTHIAEALLAVLNAGAKLLDLFTKLPLPILATVVALHGIYLWSGLAASGIVALLRPFSRMAAAAAGAKLAGSAVQDLANMGGGTRLQRLGAVFADLGTNLKAIPGRVSSLAKSLGGLFASPWTWAVIGAAAIIGIAVAIGKTRDAAHQLVDSINQLVTHATIFNVINTTSLQLVQTNNALAEAQQKVANSSDAAARSSTVFAGRAGQLRDGVAGASESVKTLTTEHAKLVGQLGLATGRIASIAGAYGTDGLAGAMALASIAGVKVDQLLSNDKTVWAAALQQIDGVVQGYQNMGQSATQLGNDINVLTIAQSDQLKNIQTLNSAFDNFTQIVSGPIDSFLSLANTLKRFGNDAQVSGAQMSGLGSGIVGVSHKVTDASLQLQTDFQDTFKSATQMADAMRLTGTASSQQVSAIKDVVQVLIPMAGSNKAAAAEISALAQEAGGPATTNLKTLASWAGKTADPLGSAQKAAQNAAIGFSNMSLDAQKLGTTLSQDLTKDMATAVENAVGLQGAMNKFAKDIQNSGTSIATTETDRKALLNDLAAIGITGPQADSIIKSISDRLGGIKSPTEKAAVAFESFAKNALGLTTDDADNLWKVLGKQNLILTGGKVDITKKKFFDLADQLGLTKDQTDTLWKHLRDQYLDTVGVKADETKAKFEKLAEHLGLTKIQADNLWTSLHKVSAGSPYPTNIKVAADGTVNVNGYKISAGAFFSPHAEGGFISGGVPNKDSVPGMLMPGEVVVPTRMVKAGAVDHLRGRLPGFSGGGVVRGYASGGMVGDSGNVPQSFGQNVLNGIDSFAVQSTEIIAKAATLALAQWANNALGGNGSSVVQFARSFLGKIPYVFGGTSFSGDDCSGFTQAVYAHFGIKAPRTSEAQYAWATKSGPVPGGLAFYVSPAGGPPPGHVAIVQDGSSVISQGGPEGVLGPRIESLHFLPLMGTGVPKGGLPVSGGGGGNAAIASGPIQAIAMSLLRQYGWGSQWPAFNALETREAGWNMHAVNPSSGAAGLAQFINGWGEYFQYGGDPNTALGQLTAMMNYIGQRYGDPNAAWAHEQAFGWYGSGGMVPGYAAGGNVAQQGRAYLNAWRTRHGGGFGAAWGPIVLNEQIAEMKAAIGRAKTLASAKGLSSGQHKFWASAATDETKRLAVLNKELMVERAWRNQLGASDITLAKEIKVAGKLPSLAKNVKSWKSQLASQTNTIAAISKMLGYSNAFLAAHPPAPKLPPVKHTYGGDVGDTIGAYLQSVAAPFGKAMGGYIFDRGGWLKPGWNATYNGTGKAEHLVPADQGGVTVHIDVTGANSDAEKFLATMIKKYVKVRGGNVQKAYGTH